MNDAPESYFKEHRYAVIVTAILVIGGMITTPLVFPDLGLARTLFGGAAFGGFCALCAVPGRLL